MTRMPYLAVCVAICGSLTLGVPAETFAQASADRVHSIRRLGTAARFTPAIRDVKAMQTAFARPQTQSDVTTVLKLANLTPIEAQVKKAIADGAVREVAVSPGARFEWMAFRRGGTRADILRQVRWDGPKPFAAFEFNVEYQGEIYTFTIPEDCGNLTLVRREAVKPAAAPPPATAATPTAAAAAAAAAAATPTAATATAGSAAAAATAASARAGQDQSVRDGCVR